MAAYRTSPRSPDPSTKIAEPGRQQQPMLKQSSQNGVGGNSRSLSTRGLARPDADRGGREREAEPTSDGRERKCRRCKRIISGAGAGNSFRPRIFPQSNTGLQLPRPLPIPAPMPVGQSDTLLMEQQQQQQQQQAFYPQQNGFADMDAAAAAAAAAAVAVSAEPAGEAPRFVKQPEPAVRVDEGDFAHMECRLLPADDGSVQVEWFKDGRPLTAGSRFYSSYDRGCVLLDILYTHPEDSGQYVCVARNRCGADQTQPLHLTVVPEDAQPVEQFNQAAAAELDQQLQVASRQPKYGGSGVGAQQVPPQFVRALTSVSVQEGQPAHFETSLTPSADSTMQVEWLKDGAPVVPGSRVQALFERGYAALEILYCRPEDSGRYTCVATNQLGRAESSPAELSCAGSAGVVTTSNLSEASALNIRRLEEFGEEFRPMSEPHQAQDPPKFLSAVNPPQLEVKENSPATFEVQVASGSGNRVELAWFKGGQQLQTGSRINSRLEMGVATLDIYYTYAEDSGDYCAVVSSEFGQDQTAPVRLTCLPEHGVVTASQLPGNAEQSIRNLMVLEEELGRARDSGAVAAAEATGEPKVVRPLAPLPEVKENDQVYMDLQVEPAADGNIRVDWFRNGQPLNYGSRLRMECEKGVASLHLLYCYPEDSGEYWAVVSNKAGSVESNRVGLVCHAGDAVVTQSQLPGDSQGYKRLEEMEREWREAPVTGADFQFSQPEEPKSPPQFDVAPEANTVCEGFTARFLVKLSGNPRPRVAWYINDLMIAQTSNYKIYNDGAINYLEILRCKEPGETRVKAVARNQLGEVAAETGLTVVPTEDFRPDLKHVQLENNFKRLLDLRKVQRSDELETKIAKPKASIIEFRKVERESEIKSRLFKDPEVEQAESMYLTTQAGLKGGHYAGLMEVQEVHEMQLQQHKEQLKAESRAAEAAQAKQQFAPGQPQQQQFAPGQPQQQQFAPGQPQQQFAPGQPQQQQFAPGQPR